MATFGTLLRSLREKKKRKIKEIADLFNWSVVYVSDIERSRRNPPSFENIIKIARFLEEPPNKLLITAMKDGKGIELLVKNRSDKVSQAAFMLARSWEGLSDEDAEKILEVLMKDKKEPEKV